MNDRKPPTTEYVGQTREIHHGGGAEVVAAFYVGVLVGAVMACVVTLL